MRILDSLKEKKSTNINSVKIYGLCIQKLGCALGLWLTRDTMALVL